MDTVAKSYCEVVNQLEPGDLHRDYHDNHYGFPLTSDDELFGRLLLEINQAGLSWTTILKKQDNFKSAYSNYSIEAVAAYGEKDKNRLLNDSGIIRNRLKIEAAIHNANQILKIQEEYGSFMQWLNQHHPLKREDWVKLFKKTFKFTGGEITNEFLLSTGYLKGAHHPNCPIYKKTLSKNPPWAWKLRTTSHQN